MSDGSSKVSAEVCVVSQIQDCMPSLHPQPNGEGEGQGSSENLKSAVSVESPRNTSSDEHGGVVSPPASAEVLHSLLVKATDSSQPCETQDQDGAVKVQQDSPAQSGVSTVSVRERSIVIERDEKKSAAAVNRDKPVCTFFKKAGWCRFGGDCRFLHQINTQESAKVVEDHGRGCEQLLPVAATNQNQDESGSSQRQTCRFYARSGWCRYGFRCRFAHVTGDAKSDGDHSRHSTQDEARDAEGAVRPNIKVEEDDEGQDELQREGELASADNDEEPSMRRGKSATQPRTKKRCRFYDGGFCRAGRRCRFLHEARPQAQDQEQERNAGLEEGRSSTDPAPAQAAEDDGGDWQPARKPVGHMTSRPLTDLQEGDAACMRETEISQLKKRFPGDRLEEVETEEENTENPSYRFTVSPTDPDWPYDLKDFEVEVNFPAEYPVKPLCVKLPGDQVLPTIILGHLCEAITEWVDARAATNQLSGRVELMVRPFLRWFDRNLMRLFTEGARKFKKEVYAKAAGFEFISYAKTQGDQDPNESGEMETGEMETDAPAHYKEAFINHEVDQDINDGGRDNEKEDEEEDGAGTVQEPDLEGVASGISDLSTSPQRERVSPPPTSRVFVSPTENRRGTEIRLVQLEMSESAATLTCRKVRLRIQCSRCRGQSDLAVTAGRVMVVGCGKCQNQQAVGYRPCIVHQFSSVLGFLDLTGCVPVDLIIFECSFNVSCLNCSSETNLQGIQYGQTRLVWCTKCHLKMSLGAEVARFQRLMASVPEGKTEVVVVKKAQRVKDPAIKEGTPLPANGTCQHYKKSFRWLRFPCCGKCYPCDECHDQAEMDHEMKFASRMICGFCSKEQPYSAEKPCTACGSNVTKSRTSHWEGGTGCRNRTKMNRIDKQKYSNLNKTTSRKAQKAEDAKKGKKK